MKRIMIVLGIFLFTTIVFVGCGGDDGGSKKRDRQDYYWSYGRCYEEGTNRQVNDSYCDNANDYYLTSQGRCFDAATDQEVDRSRCDNTGYGGNYHGSNYYLSAGNCYSYSTGQPVDRSLCDNTYGGNQECIGTYYTLDSYGWLQPYVCNSAQDCSGFMLYTSSYQQVNCK